MLRSLDVPKSGLRRASQMAGALAAVSFAVLTGPARSEQPPNCAATGGSLAELVSCARSSASLSCDRGSSNARAEVVWPVQGRIIRHFGAPAEYGTISRGTVFEAKPSDTVRTPVSGTVTYSGVWGYFGDTLIVDDCNRVAVLAGIIAFEAEVGKKLVAGEPVGEMRVNAEGQSLLYLELRDNTNTIDPNIR